MAQSRPPIQPSFTIGAPATPFTQGNLAAIQIDTTGNNTTFSVVELQPSAAGQTKPVNITPITATGTNALRLSSSGSCGHLSLSDDGTFLVFAAFDDDSSATPDETFNLNRAVGTLNYANQFTKTGEYVSDSFGGSQARSACSPDNSDFLIDDKGGLYVYDSASPQTPTPNVYVQNNYCTRSFGRSAWVLTQKVVADLPSPSVFQFNNGYIGELDYYDSGYDGPYNTISATPPPDGNVVDFYMMSTNGSTDPASFDVLYTLDQNSGANGSSGVISKWTTIDQSTWTFDGAWTNSDNGDSLFATTNGSGGVYLYYTDGSGGTAKNSLIRVTDASVNGPISIISSNLVYTAAAGTSIEGVTFVPVPTAYTNAPIPPPILTAQKTAPVSSTFSITNTPDDPAWRDAITGITVNGSLLPTAAYGTNQAGKIVFDPSQSGGLLTTPGSKNILISATGYSTNSIVQTLSIGTASQLVVTTQPTAPSADGSALVTQPVLKVEDIYSNVVTNSSASITATAGQATWTLGGATTKAAVSGIASFTGLTAFSTNAVTGATIHFASSGLTGADSTPGFSILAPIQSVIGGVIWSNGQLTFTFTNASGLSFSVLATNDISAPLTNWPVIGTAVENPAGSGNYQFTNSAATNAQEFYILRQP